MADRGEDGLFELTVEERDAFTVLRLAGELDVFTTSRLRAELDRQLVDEGRVHLVVDLTDLAFMDSSGLGTLIRAHRQARRLRGSFAVVCPDGPVLKVMAVTGLVHVLRVHGTLAAATAESPAT